MTYCSAMAEVASGGERVREGEAALARGAWAEARAIFEEELEAGETLEALEGLSWAAWWIEDVPAASTRASAPTGWAARRGTGAARP